MKSKRVTNLPVSSNASVSQESGRPFGEGEHQDRISTAAYYKAEARGFTPGGEVDDWLAAETEYYASIQ